MSACVAFKRLIASEPETDCVVITILKDRLSLGAQWPKPATAHGDASYPQVFRLMGGTVGRFCWINWLRRINMKRIPLNIVRTWLDGTESVCFGKTKQ